MRNTQPVTPRDRSLSRLYVFMVVTLATFLALLAFAHTPIRQITAGIDLRLEMPRADATAGPPEHRVNWSELVQQEMNAMLAVDRLLPVAADAGVLKQTDQTWGEQGADELLQRLKMESRTSADGGAALVSIYFRGQQEQAAVAFVRKLADNFAQHVQERHLRQSPAKTSPPVDSGVAAAEERMKTARRELDQILAEGLRAIRDLESSKASRAPSSRVLERPNPAWTELEHQLAEAQAGHDRISTNRSDDHPVVQRSRRRVENLAEQLRHVPKYLKSTDTEALPLSSPPSRAQQIQRVMKSDVYLAKLSEFQEAERAFNLALMAHSAPSSAPGPSALPITAIPVSAAHVVARHGSVLSRNRFFLFATISCVVAALFCRLMVDQRYGVVFTSVSQVRDAIGPIVGRLRLTARRPQKGEAARYQLNRASVVASEFFIGAVIVMLAMFSLADARFASHLADDPFSAYTHAVSRVMQWFL